VIYCMTEFNC